MFTGFCEGHGADVLLGPDNIEGLTNHDEAIELRWVCWCGWHGATVYPAPCRAGQDLAGR